MRAWENLQCQPIGSLVSGNAVTENLQSLDSTCFLTSAVFTWLGLPAELDNDLQRLEAPQRRPHDAGQTPIYVGPTCPGLPSNTHGAKMPGIDSSVRDSDIAKTLGLAGMSDTPSGEEGASGWQEEDDDPEPVLAGLPDPDDDEGQISDVDFERPSLAFSDVGGMDDVKDEISMKVIQPLAHPELFAAYGKKVGGGVLMYGPPGCGKTHLARATAGEAKASFMSVGIHEVLEMWIGSSERNLRRIFDEARRRTPCVLFFDEVDALGAKRSGAANNSGRQIINQFLSELDGLENANDGLLILAATNAPWHLDAAFRRPGRFDRLVFVPPPDAAARASILDVQLRDKPSEGIDTTKVAKKTERFSGADLKGLIDLAVEEKLREALKSGVPTPLTEKDLLRSAKRIKPSTGEWFATAKNHVLFANEGGSYDDVASYMGLKPKGDRS